MPVADIQSPPNLPAKIARAVIRFSLMLGVGAGVSSVHPLGNDASARLNELAKSLGEGLYSDGYDFRHVGGERQRLR